MILWREIQKLNFTSVKKLAAFLELDEEKQKELLFTSSFSLNLPMRLAKKIKKNTLDDPILRQFVPLVQEEESSSFCNKDPLEEKKFRTEKKLLVKYQSRALLLATSSCVMHCRFCFRRHFPYERAWKGFEKEIEYIRLDTSLQEVILSGGDPLSLPNEALEALFSSIDSIDHIKRIRIHTRFPIGIPERIDSDFLALLKRRCQIIFVIHSNHPKELDDDVIDSLKKIQSLGIPILNQNVLLKGVNDSLQTLKELYETLTNSGFLPYYLHDLDEVEGAGHFKVPQDRALTTLKHLSSELSGYAIPKFVKEIAGSTSKTSLFF